MKNKEPGLLRKIIDIQYEQAKRRRALRILSQQEWSFDFLVEIIRKAADLRKDNIEVEITTKGGHKMRVIKSYKDVNHLSADDSIFNHLDDEAAVAAFIRDHAPRG